MSRFGILLLAIGVLGTLAGAAIPDPPGDDAPVPATGGSAIAIELAINGPIGPATKDFFVRGIDTAVARRAPFVLVEIDTPGGLDTAMRDMIQSILASPVPVVMFVSPSGARAASAGTYLMYASHIAAMAPATNLGAATPVSIGMAPAPSRPGKASPDQGQKDESHDDGADANAAEGSAMERKAVNDAVAYIRSLAELRGRNVDWAEEAVRGAASLSAKQALEMNVIDLIAADVPDLLRQIDGRQVHVSTGDVTIASSGVVLEKIEADWRTRLLAVITNPNVAYILMLVGIYGLLFEGYNPGAVLPGVAGAICLLLALFAFQVLSVNYAGLALILLGVLLMIAEAFVPSFGALGLGGILAFVIGSIMLMDSDVPGLRIAKPLIGAMGFVGGLAALGIVTFAVRSRRRPVVTGRDQLLNECPIAVDDFEREGTVRLHGELWNAVSATPVRAGQRLRVIRVDGLTLTVEPHTD
jgi:membrane-bound serine protease (ClpP class)